MGLGVEVGRGVAVAVGRGVEVGLGVAVGLGVGDGVAEVPGGRQSWPVSVESEELLELVPLQAVEIKMAIKMKNRKNARERFCTRQPLLVR